MKKPKLGVDAFSTNVGGGSNGAMYGGSNPSPPPERDKEFERACGAPCGTVCSVTGCPSQSSSRLDTESDWGCVKSSGPPTTGMPGIICVTELLSGKA